MTTTLPMQGTCDARFTAVREVFAENFAHRGDVGAAVCVYVESKPVVDLWGGYANASRTRPWERHTIASVASTTKGMVAICAHLLVERGLLDLDAPVARYWPEFAQAGKADLPVRWLLSHRAGLPAVRCDMPLQSLFDWYAYPPKRAGGHRTLVGTRDTARVSCAHLWLPGRRGHSARQRHERRAIFPRRGCGTARGGLFYRRAGIGGPSGRRNSPGSPVPPRRHNLQGRDHA
jgi:hypothetical protein